MVNIDGRDLKERKLNDLKFKLDNLGSQLGLAVLQVGEDEASKVYIRQKENAVIHSVILIFINIFQLTLRKRKLLMK